MARLFADENFPRPVVDQLRQMGHDVVTLLQRGWANDAVPDQEVLRLATIENRILLTLNRRDFIRLHHKESTHSGIIVCTEDPDGTGLALATRIDAVLRNQSEIAGHLMRVNRPSG
ncbi:MAG: DUF5615 family PIN-like protein [Gemmataceae bacterium]